MKPFPRTLPAILSSLPIYLTVALCISCTEAPSGGEIHNRDRSNSIIGGEVVTLEDPSLNGVLRNKLGFGDYSAVQVSESVILTAAHCSEYSGKRMEVARYTKNADEGFQNAVIGELLLHPQYEDTVNGSDLALTILDRFQKLEVKDSFDLPTSAQLPEDLFIAGYGKAEFTEASSVKGVLKKLKLSKSKHQITEVSRKTLDPDIAWEAREDFQTINQRIIDGELYCFKSLEENINVPFSGDSGGPLYSVDPSGRRTVHGVFSIFIFDAKIPNYFFYCYESIFPKLDWIQKTIGKPATAESSGLEIKFSDKTVSLKNKIFGGVDITETRQIKGEVIDAGMGRSQDLPEKVSKGSILLIKRGDFPFSDKVSSALSAHKEIAGILIYNNVEGELFTPSLGQVSDIGKIDVRFISLQDGENILSEIKKGNKVEAHLTFLRTE